MTQTTHFPDSVRQWLTTPLGKALLQQESRIVEEVLDGTFGEQCLQLGSWGDANLFMRHARTQCKALIDESGVDGPSAIGRLHALPVATESVDCVLLPHTLDFSDRRHEILREVDRVLTPHGHVMILGFKTGGLWGVRRLIPGAGLPPGSENLVVERQLSDWLKLLDMRIQGIDRYFFRWPLPGNRGASSARWEQRGQRWWPEFAACYMLTAQKRVSTLTPVRPVWRKQLEVVPGLAETSHRVSRIRFDQKN